MIIKPDKYINICGQDFPVVVLGDPFFNNKIGMVSTLGKSHFEELKDLIVIDINKSCIMKNIIYSAIS